MSGAAAVDTLITGALTVTRAGRTGTSETEAGGTLTVVGADLGGALAVQTQQTGRTLRVTRTGCSGALTVQTLLPCRTTGIDGAGR